MFDFSRKNYVLTIFPMLATLGSKGSLLFEFVDFKGAIGVIVFPKIGANKTFGLRFSQKWVKEYEFRVVGADRSLGFDTIDGSFKGWMVD